MPYYQTNSFNNDSYKLVDELKQQSRNWHVTHTKSDHSDTLTFRNAAKFKAHEKSCAVRGL